MHPNPWIYIGQSSWSGLEGLEWTGPPKWIYLNCCNQTGWLNRSVKPLYPNWLKVTRVNLTWFDTGFNRTWMSTTYSTVMTSLSGGWHQLVSMRGEWWVKETLTWVHLGYWCAWQSLTNSLSTHRMPFWSVWFLICTGGAWGGVQSHMKSKSFLILPYIIINWILDLLVFYIWFFIYISSVLLRTIENYYARKSNQFFGS